MRKRKIMVIGIVFVYFITAILVFGTYIQKDDAGIRSVLSGTMTGIPDGHMIFVSYFFGWFVSCLYKIAPFANWYGLIEMAAFVTAMTVFLQSILKKYYSKGKEFIVLLIFSILIYTVLIFQLFVSINFTYAADLYLASALLLLLDYQKGEKKSIIASFVCCLLGASIRIEAFYMTIPFILLIIIYKVLKKELDLRKYLIVLSIGIAVIMLFEYIGYREPEWKEFKESRQYLSALIDYYGWPDYNEYKEVYNDLNIYEEEKALLDESIYIIDGVDVEKAIQVCGKLQIDQHGEVFSRNRMVTALYRLHTLFIEKEYVIFNYILIVIGVMAAVNMGRTQAAKKDYIFASCAIAVSLFELLYLCWNGRVIFRAVVGVQIILLTIIIGLINRFVFYNYTKKRTTLTLLLGMICFYLALINLSDCKYNALECKEHKQLTDDIASYCSQNEDNFYFTTNSRYIYDNSNTIINNRTDNKDNILSLGSRTCFEKDILADQGIDSIVEALVNREDIYIISDNSDKTLHALNTLKYYVNRSYEGVDYHIIEDHGEFQVLKLKR